MLHKDNFRDFEPFGINRLVFDGPKGAKGPVPENPEGGSEKPGATPEKKREIERSLSRLELKKLGKAVEVREEERVIDESGEAKEYVETFKGSPRFDALSKNLSIAIKAGSTFANFENWPVSDSTEVGALFDTPLFPYGKGKDAFVLGLEEGPADPADKSAEAGTRNAKFEASQKALKEIVALLREDAALRQKEEEAAEKIQAKPIVGDTIGTGIKTLMKNFKRAPGTEKLLMLGAIGIGLWLANKYKDQPIPGTKDFTWGKLMMGVGALWGINYMSGKVSADGRTLLQRMDVMSEIDDLGDDSVLRVFAHRNGMREDQEKLRTYYKLLHTDLKQLYRLYEGAEKPGVKREIDPEALGFYKKEIDGAAAYEIMDALVKQTAANELIQQWMGEAEEKGVAYTGPRSYAQFSKAQKEQYLASGAARAFFERKYVSGDGLMGNMDVTLFDAIINENRRENVRKSNEEERASGTYAQSIEWAKKKGRYGIKMLGKGTVVAGAAVYTAGKATIDFSYNKVLKPIGHYARAKWNKLSPYAIEPVKSRVAVSQENYLNEVVPASFALDVTEVNVRTPGKATIMGMPGITFETYTRQDGKDVAVIDGVEFIIAEKLAGAANISAAKKLESQIQKRVERLATVKGAAPQWDEIAKLWRVAGVDVKVRASLGLGTPLKTTLYARVNSDGKSLTYFAGGNEVKNEKNLEINYVESVVLAILREHNTQFKNYADNLPVKIKEINDNSAVGAIIVGTIGGLEFQGSLKKNPTDKTGLKRILVFDKIPVMNEKNGGPEFLDSLKRNILTDSYFRDPFLNLEAQMTNTGEGFMARMREANKTKRLWIIPTNVEGALNGRIMQRQWQYTLEFKMFETLDMFTDELKGKSVADIEAAYKKHIERTHNQLEKISRYIASLNDEQKADKFAEILSGLGDTTRGIPAGLEYVNYREVGDYPNEAYSNLLKEYQAVITNPRYNYRGLESLDPAISLGSRSWGAADGFYEMYQTMLRVWSFHTRAYANGETGEPAGKLSAKTETFIRNGVVGKVRTHLERAMKAGGGVIKAENLPGKGSPDEAALNLWVK